MRDAFSPSSDSSKSEDKPLSMKELCKNSMPMHISKSQDASNVFRLDESDIQILERWRGFVEKFVGHTCTHKEVLKALLRYIDDEGVTYKPNTKP